MKEQKIIITLQVAWWFEYYFYTLLFFCKLLSAEPDYEKLGNVYKKAVKVSLKKGDL